MKILVISSCTGEKLCYRTSAAEIYSGGQHQHLMKGLEQVWDKYGKNTIDLAIISAKYGLLRESDVISCYNETFAKLSEKSVLERSKALQIRENTEALIRHYNLVFFLLGKEYIWSLGGAFTVTDAVTQIFLAGKNSRRWIPHNSHFIHASNELRRQFKTTHFDLKGHVFEKLCAIVCERGLEVFEIINQNPQKFVDFVLDGTQAELNS